MATDRTNIGYKFENGDIPSQGDFQEVFNSFIHKDEDKADFQMVETGTDNLHYVTPALLRAGLQNIGIITGNSYMPLKEHFDNFVGNTITLQYAPINYSVKVFKNGQLLLEKEGQGNDGDYIINYEMAKITFSGNIDNRNIEVDYWYKNLTPNPGGGSGEQIDFTSFLHTSGNETKNGILTFNNTTPTSTSGIVLTNSGADAGAKVLDVTVSGSGSGISVQNTAAGTGIKVSNTGAGAGLQVNSSSTATGDPLQVSKDNVVKAKIDSEGTVTAKEFVTAGGLRTQFVKGDGFLDPTTYADDTKVIHIEGNEERDGALKLTHNNSVEDVLTITKNNSANCLKLVQNSSSSATTSTFDTNTENNNRKAISVQKIQVEKAFITHDGNVSGTSFTTLNEKADITDGFLTLAPSDSATAMAGHAKLYAKTDGTTDLYVMGSDGVEKKIGGEVDLSGKENTIATGTTAQYFRGDKTWQTLDKTAVGLSNVDNTSDLNKPVSTATQTALNLKANLASAPLTGIPTAPTAAAGTNTTQIATTAFVTSANSNYVDKTTDQTIGGVKRFNYALRFPTDYNYSSGGVDVFIGRVSGHFTFSSAAGLSTANVASLSTELCTTAPVLKIPNQSGTIALTNNPTSITATSFVKSGGTSSQYLMADGSVTTSAGTSSSSGSFTPTLTPALNCSSMILKSATYTKIGDIVTVMVTAYGTVTSVSSATFLDISLPINRAGTSSLMCGYGSVSPSSNVIFYAGEVQIQSGQKARLITVSPPNATGDNFRFIASFQYNIND